LIQVSENANRLDDLGCTSHGKGPLAIFVIIVISVLLVGYSVSQRAQVLSQHSFNLKEDPQSQYGGDGIQGFNHLFGNFSGMTIVENFTAPDGTESSEVISYSVLNTTIINGMKTFLVNISGVARSYSEVDPEYCLAWISTSSGLVVQTYDGDDGYLQGQKAQQENATLSAFTTQPLLSMLNSSTVEPVQAPKQSITLGQVTMSVTIYLGLQSFNHSLKDWIVDIGTVPQNSFRFVVFCTFVSSSGYQFTFHIISMS
jgi:hypothetical protein